MARVEARGAAATVSTTGVHTTLVLRVYWASTDEVTASQIKTIFAADSAFFTESAYGGLALSPPRVTAWLQLPGPPTCESPSSIKSNAYSAALAAGYGPDTFDHDMIYISRTDCGPGNNYGELGGKWTWIRGDMGASITAHELGHNLGLLHSHSLRCDLGVTIGDDCTRYEYGDLFDTMGWAWGAPDGNSHFNAFQKNLLGWLDGRLTDVTQSGTYTLAPYESQAPGLDALRIVTPQRIYFVENRNKLGFDSDLPDTATNGALVHVVAPEGGSDLLDMSPIDDDQTFQDWPSRSRSSPAHPPRRQRSRRPSLRRPPP